MAPSRYNKLQKHHLQPTLRAPSRYDGTDDRHTQQAGRSATSISAQASAQTIREASRSRHTSRARVELVASEPVSTAPEANRLFIPRPEPHRRLSGSTSPYAPAVSSPLNPAPSHSSSLSDARKNSDASTVSFNGVTIAPRRSGTAVELGRPLRSGRQSPSHTLGHPSDIKQVDSFSSISSVRDLGSDYTRYFNPFATRTNSANTSHHDLPASTARLPTFNHSATHLAPAHAVSATDLSKRLSTHSNPFTDDRRISASLLPEIENEAETIESDHENPVNKGEVGVTKAAVLTRRVGTPAFIHNADPEKAPFFPYMDDRLGAPMVCSFPLYSDQQEDDDDMHMPHWDDDRKYKPTMQERFSRENLVNAIGCIFLIIGLLTIFVVLPVVSFMGASLLDYTYETPLDQMPGHGKPDPWVHVNNRKYPLLRNIRSGLIDPDTPDSVKTRKAVNGDPMVLVFSDEFNGQNRTFYEGDDPYWLAPDIWYGATQDLEWYDPDAVNTGNGTLQLQLDMFQNHGLAYRSGMLNSWNQLCFKGGVFEVSVSLPGPAGVHGLWPGAWTMGNLGRPGHLATTEGLWPYTYNDCDTGITPNQSMTDGTSWLPGQRLPSCSCKGEDHPSPGTGRGAPEIDIIEVSADWSGMGLGVATQSYQVAPFDIFYYPNYDFMETPNYNVSMVNTYTGGPFQEAISTTTTLNNDWYDGKVYQKYSFEYEPGSGKDAHVTWRVGDDEMMRFDARAIGPNGNIQQRLISEEPMSLILNLGISHSWVAIDDASLRFPTVMRFDYVRWYQKEGEEMVTCDPPGYETTEYIANHPAAYNNPNYTRWSEAGYEWPKNTLMHGCEA